MSEREKLARLAEVAQLIYEQKMLVLERTARARQASLDRLAELDRPMPAADLPLIQAEEIALRHALWADRRRREINAQLALQTADWVEARDEAARALGRNQVLDRIGEKLALRRDR